jgi:hypothetical protein
LDGDLLWWGRMEAEDLIEIERAGRRCSVCHSGRGWRRFEVVRPPELDPVVMCGSCRARFGDSPRVGHKPAVVAEPAPVVAEPAPVAKPPRGEQRPDRLRPALAKMPASFSTAMVARAAGLNNDKARARLEDLERRGEVRRVGKRWTTEPPPTDLTAAIDRLEARTSNLRIVRDRAPAG